MTDHSETSPERAAEQRRALVAWSWAHPGVELVQGAALVGVTLDVAAMMLGDRARLHPRHERPRERTYTDAELRAWVAAYVADAPHPTWRDMDTWLRDHDGPSVATVRKRWGRWADVLAAAVPSPLTDDEGATPGP